MNRLNDLRAELVRARAYRFWWLAWPLIAVIAAGFSLFAVLAARDELAAGGALDSAVRSLAFAPGGATALTGLVVAILATSLVTGDETSGTGNLLRMTMSDRRMLAARTTLVVVACLIATGIVSLAAVGAAALLAPGVLAATLASGVVWGNVVGALVVHLVWATLALAAASAWPRAAIAMGAVLVVMLGLPMGEFALRGAGVDTAALAYLPEALTRAALVTGENPMTTVAPWVAVACLAAWCAALVALSGAGLSRLRRA